MAILVAPTEPVDLKKLGRSSSMPERYGADFMWASRMGLVGVQRKRWDDLIASVHDGRLGKELGQLQQVDLPVLVVEGKMHWTGDGELVARYHNWTKAQHRGLLWSVRSQGIWVDESDGLDGTKELLCHLERWTNKDVHSLVRGRPKSTSKWGTTTNEDYAIHLLTSLPGVGTKTAQAIFDHFKKVPMRWEVTEEQLMEVDGIGKVRAKSLIEVLK